MPARTVTVASQNGLHARPASQFVKQVSDLGIDVTIAKQGSEPVDAGSIMLVLSQNICHGDTVTLASEAAEAEAALDKLVEMLSLDLDAEHA